MSLPKVLNICKKNITNMRIVLTEFEKKEGVKIFTSFNMFKVKYIEIDSKITTLCKIQNCSNKIENFNLCIKHINYYYYYLKKIIIIIYIV